jgi:hypothetical protein
MWRTRDKNVRRWLLLAALMMFFRLGFFATLENPEPRYTVELFPFLMLLGAVGLPIVFRQDSQDLQNYHDNPENPAIL